MIPKIIHLCWLSNNDYPPKIKRCLQSWQKYLPEYKIMLWDTKRFNLDESIWVKQAFAKKKYAFAADYIRFYALYNYGGIYLDSDVEVLKSFNDLLQLPYFMGAEKAGTIEAAILGAEKGTDWIKICLDYYTDKTFIKQDSSLDIRKLPEIMVDELEQFKPIHYLDIGEMKNIKNMDFQKEILVMPNEYFSPKIFDSREVLVTPSTYAIHHYQNSWFSHKAKIYYRTRTILIRILGYNFIRKTERMLMPSRFK